MSEQQKMDADLRQIVTEALVSMISGVTGLVPPSGPGSIPDFVQAPIDRAVERISASLPVGVPDGLLTRIDSAIKAFTSGRASMHVPPEPDDVDMVLGECWKLVNALMAAPTVKAEQVGMADAYVGAREDLAIWKRRALEAEQKIRHQEQIIDQLTLEAQGETRFGEPSMPSAQPVAVIEYAGYDPANSIKWLNKGLQYMEPGTLLYAQAPSMPAAGSATHGLDFIIEDRNGIRVIEWKRGGCRPASSSECAMWDALSAQQFAPAYGSYTTQPAEAVAGIALRQLGDESRWVQIRDLNAHAFPDIGPHDYYPVGTVLRMPADQQSAPELVSVFSAGRGIFAMILQALDRDAAEGKAVRGEMAVELRALLASHGRGEA